MLGLPTYSKASKPVHIIAEGKVGHPATIEEPVGIVCCQFPQMNASLRTRRPLSKQDALRRSLDSSDSCITTGL